MKRIAAVSVLLLALVSCREDETPKPWNQERFSTETTVSSAVRILGEEDPGWDCKTMGNRICGPVVDIDGRAMAPHDSNGDGLLLGDIEMGS